jgi:hypothetical protein
VNGILRVTLVFMLVALAPAALADSFTYSYIGSNGIAATGTLTGDLIAGGGGALEITSGTISVSNAPVSGDGSLLLNPNSSSVSTSPLGAFYYDNVLYPGQDPLLDIDGLLFAIGSSTGTTEINLWGNGKGNPYSFWEFQDGHYILSDQGSFADPPVPEPPSLILFGVGLAGAVGLLRRKPMA